MTQPMLAPYYLLGNDDNARDHALRVFSRHFYRRVLGDTALLQYFAALLFRGDARLRATLPDGNDREELERKIAETAAWIFGKPVDPGYDLTIHLRLFNITPDHFWRTHWHFMAALTDDMGLPLPAAKVAGDAWFAVAPQIVRRWAPKPATPQDAVG